MMASISAGFERSALDLGANRIEAFRRSGGTDRHETAHGLGKAPERRLGKADFVGPDQGVLVGDQERGKQHFRATPQLNPAEAAEDIGPQRARVARNHDHVFASGVQADTWRIFQLADGSVLLFGNL